MRTICRDWSNGTIHEGLLVIRDDGKGGPDNDTICYDCLWFYRVQNNLEWLNKPQEVRSADDLSPDDGKVARDE